MIDDRPEKLSPHEVAVWLRRHPDFLGQFPDLAVSLVVPKEDGRAASRCATSTSRSARGWAGSPARCSAGGTRAGPAT